MNELKVKQNDDLQGVCKHFMKENSVLVYKEEFIRLFIKMKSLHSLHAVRMRIAPVFKSNLAEIFSKDDNA